MLYYDRIDISKGIYPAKSNSSKECIMCHYWFLNKGFKSQYFACNDCHDVTTLFHDLTTLCLNISNITVITSKSL